MVDPDVIAQAMADAAQNEGLAQVDDNKLIVISELALKQQSLEARKAKLEEDLKQVEKDLKKVSEYDLPNAMIEIGMRDFTLTDGAKINVKKVYVAGIKVENRHEAFGWLIEKGHEALIKTVVGVDVGKGESELAEELKKMIAEFLIKHERDGLEPTIDQSVHWQTLRAFVKEQIEAENKALNDGVVLSPDEVLPRELLGVHIIDKAEIKLPKQKK